MDESSEDTKKKEEKKDEKSGKNCYFVFFKGVPEDLLRERFNDNQWINVSSGLVVQS